jgi:hypothetical protein
MNFAQLMPYRSMRSRLHLAIKKGRLAVLDIGSSKITCLVLKLDPPSNPYAWQRFSQTVRLPQQGYYEIWARATDDRGHMQPFAIAWNPKGYMNNSMHRISVYAS